MGLMGLLKSKTKPKSINPTQLILKTLMPPKFLKGSLKVCPRKPLSNSLSSKPHFFEAHSLRYAHNKSPFRSNLHDLQG
jgi:hypothetical protein